jgi:hypothetical protein
VIHLLQCKFNYPIELYVSDHDYSSAIRFARDRVVVTEIFATRQIIEHRSPGEYILSEPVNNVQPGHNCKRNVNSQMIHKQKQDSV